jgi:hypothetical protein
VIEYLRLAFGTVAVLLPGAAVARAFGHRSMSATLTWGLGCIAIAWAAVFTLHRSIHLAVAVLAVFAVAGLIAARKRRPVESASRAPLWLFGIVLGWFLWHVEGAVVGDGLFHEARVRKLVDFGSLHLRTVDEFKDGGLHPGYAFPLWHGFLALVSWFSGLDPEQVIRHEPSLLVPIVCVVTWEAGVAVFKSKWAGLSVLAAQLAISCFGPEHGGAWSVLALPATSGRQLFAPAAIALFFERRLAATAVAFGVLTLVHPTYSVFLLIPLLAVAAWEWRSWLAGAVPVGLVLLWLRPVIEKTGAQNPAPGERLRALLQYRDQLVVKNVHHYRLAPEVLGRTGSVAVLTLFLLPVTALAIRHRWAQFVLGGTLIVLLLVEVPWLFVHFSNAVSLSQSRRAAGFAPLPFAFAGVLAVVVRRWFALPLAFIAGIVLQQLWPGDYLLGLRHGGPGLATWVALFGGLAALVAVLVARPKPPREHHALAAAAAFLFIVPVVVHGMWHWSPTPKFDKRALSPRLVHNLRTKVPKGAIVIAPLIVSYRVAASAPVYIVGAPVTHVANTTANKPYVRRRDIQHWVLTNDPRIARRYHATWAIRSGRLYRLPG